MRKIFLSSLIVSIGLLVSACSTQTQTQTPTTPTMTQPSSAHTVQIKGYTFTPDDLTILKGETITWENLDDVDHTVTGKGFDSKVLKHGDKFVHTFNTAGTFDYACTLHPTIIGKITVK